MNIIRVFFTNFMLMMSFVAMAESQPNIPDILRFEGKPIDPLCLFEAGEQEGVINLKNCGLKSEPGRSIAEKNKDLLDKGYYGYDYRWKVDETNTSECYSYYKPLEVIGNSAVVLTRNNSGGSGQFSALIVVSRDGNNLKITPYDGGDRCNGGISNVRVEQDAQGNKFLLYSVNLTPFDYLDLAKSNPHNLEAYQDLESCAACCRGEAFFKRSLDSNFAAQSFSYIDLNSVVFDSEPSDEIKYQACFDKLLAKAKKTNTKLDPEALASFVNNFNRNCYPHKP